MEFNPDNGYVFLVDKPLHWTSFDVVNKMRYAILKKWHLQIQDSPEVKRKIKVGHAGTLDPLATGLLIVCAGKETSNIDAYMATSKEYTGEIYLGETTPSYDRETEVNERFDISHINEQMILDAASQYTGDFMQVPPIYSAIKKGGKKLYESARAGEVIIPDPRPISIHSFEITEIKLPLVSFKVKCSKGTYIRSLAFDFGKILHSGACLNSLRRTKSGDFSVSDARSVEDTVAFISA